MKTQITSIVTEGLRPIKVTLEGCHGRGYGGIQTLGTHNDTTQSIREKIAALLEVRGTKVGHRKTLLSCSPNLSQHASYLDLATAVCLYQIERGKPYKEELGSTAFIGELSLDGELRYQKGIMAIVLFAYSHNIKRIILPQANQSELETFRYVNDSLAGIEVLYFRDLDAVLNFLESSHYETHSCLKISQTATKPEGLSFNEMYLSDEVKDLICTVITGRHNLFLKGTPGTGKSMLAERLVNLLPKLSKEDHIDVLSNHCHLGKDIEPSILSGSAPYRSPHHLSSAQAILGTPEIPGDLALAHGGILFLDELPEFRRDLLEGLREPLESGKVEVSRSQKKSSWTCKIILIAAANDCPCGWLGSRVKLCTCPQQKISAYQRKLSGPLLDRIDLHFQMPEALGDSRADFLDKCFPNQERQLKDRIESALKFRNDRVAEVSRLSQDKQLSLWTECAVKDSDREGIQQLLSKIHSRRSQVKTLRVARTLADLDSSRSVFTKHVRRAMAWSQKSDEIQST